MTKFLFNQEKSRGTCDLKAVFQWEVYSLGVIDSIWAARPQSGTITDGLKGQKEDAPKAFKTFVLLITR